MLRGDLLEVTGRFFIVEHEVFADFFVLWRHPVDGVSGVFRGPVGGWPTETRCDMDLLVLAAEGAIEDAEGDFAYDGAFFARDLRIAPVRDATEPQTRAALAAGPPYPYKVGQRLHVDLETDPHAF